MAINKTTTTTLKTKQNKTKKQSNRKQNVKQKFKKNEMKINNTLGIQGANGLSRKERSMLQCQSMKLCELYFVFVCVCMIFFQFFFVAKNFWPKSFFVCFYLEFKIDFQVQVFFWLVGCNFRLNKWLFGWLVGWSIGGIDDERIIHGKMIRKKKEKRNWSILISIYIKKYILKWIKNQYKKKFKLKFDIRQY